MRAEPPDQLTQRVWQMLTNAQTGTLATAEVIEELVFSLRRQVWYLAYRRRGGCQTAYDEVAHSDVDALARAIHLLQESEVHP